MDIISQLKRDEGVRANPYKDSRGIWTVGVGHNLEANPLPNETYPLSDARIDQILQDDLTRTSLKLFASLPWAPSLPDAYKGILQNMAFNMGVNGLLAFHHMLAKLQAGDCDGAADEMQNSSWFHQVGDRAKRLVQQMRTGVWV